MRNFSRVLPAALGIAMVCGLALVGVVPASAVTATAKASFVASLVKPAQQTQRKFGVPASVSIAQAITNSDWGTSAQAKQANNFFDTPCSAGMTASQFAQLAEAQVGKPYVLGAYAALSNADPAKFDCSELVKWLFGRSGNPITDLAAWQYTATKAVARSDSPKAGDLVFLRNNPARSNGIGHVAVVTKKLSSGDWEVIEARGRAYGVVKTTLSYWKQRSYYAGLRRYAKLVFAGGDSVTASAANLYQSGCVTISSDRYAKFTSVTNSFYGHGAAVLNDSGYKSARAVITNIPAYVDAIAKAEHPTDAAGYAGTLNSLINSLHLTDYDVIPFDIVLLSGNKGSKVTALQYLLTAGGTGVKATGTYDSATKSAVKKYQAAKKLGTDGEAGPLTLTSLFTNVATGATGDRVKALHALLASIGQTTTAGATFGTETVAALKAFQATAGRSGSGVADANTWALLYMTPDQAPAPVVTGLAKVTATLSATVGKWGPGSFTLSYQWYRAGRAISGATATSYTLTPEDAGATVTVGVTGTRPGYTTIRRLGAATSPVALAKLDATPIPKVTGKAIVGGRLTAVPGTWSPDKVNLSYQWYRGTTAIPGAVAATYAVQAADVAAKVKVVVTGRRAGYGSVATTSAVTTTVAKGSLTTTPAPKVTGTPTVGQRLSAAPGAWVPAPDTFAYQWYRGKTAIKGATAATYVLVAADSKAAIKVAVTGTKAGYVSASVTSSATKEVSYSGKLTTVKPKITGTARVGKTLKLTAGNWGPGPVTLTYRWYRAGKAISGATKSSYKVTKSDKGHTVTVTVTGKKSGFPSASAKSSAVKIK
ncbi:MAG: peptidoglycan-binding protein [Propionicimonas sp.]